MRINRYLVVGKRNRHNANARLTTKAPSLDSHEVAIRLDLDIPDELFSKPQLTASITIPSDSVKPAEIDSEVVSNIHDVISKELGIDLKISLVSEA